MALRITLNGRPHMLPTLCGEATLDLVIAELGLKADRIAVEHNGVIAPRKTWTDLQVSEEDRLEVVHFVGGGTPHASSGLNVLDDI